MASNENELSAKERGDLQRRLLAVRDAVGRWHNLLNWCGDIEIKETVERLEAAIGIEMNKGERKNEQIGH